MGRILLFGSVFFLSPLLNAAGFRLADQSASAAAMGNAFVAAADDPSAVWYNPAAITELEGIRIMTGSVMVYPLMKHKYSGGSDETLRKLHIPPHFYATGKINEKLAVGLGINAPFGLSTDWDKTSMTSAVATYSEIKVLDYNLNAAYKLTENLSFAGGISYVYLDATLKKWLTPFSFEQDLSGDGSALGWNTAVFYRPNEKWSMGFKFKSAVKVDIENGTNKMPGTTYNDANTSIKLPDMLQFGAAYRHNEKWLFSAEADYTDWTTYRQLVVRWNNDASSSVNVKNWKSVWAIRLGSEYKYSDAWKFRAGFFYDFNPVKEKYFETRMPDSDRLAFSLGAGYSAGAWTIDAVYQYVRFTDRSVDSSVQDDSLGNVLNGDYESSVHLPGISVGYKF